jgi:hypothetical protein
MANKAERIYQEVKLSTVLEFYASGFSAGKGKKFLPHVGVEVVAVDVAKGKVVYALMVVNDGE